MKKKLFKVIALLSIFISGLTGCGNKSDLSSGNFEIQFTKTIPTAYVKETYNFLNVLIVQEGIQYSISAHYFDYNYSDIPKMKELPIVNGFSFVPVNRSDIIVTVNANNASFKKSRVANVRVTIKGDEIDTLLSTGASQYSDPGISKDLNLSQDFIKVGNSSIYASYNGNNFYRWGATVLGPNNFRCLNCWTDKTWDNAILTFWVFNPTDYDFEFQLRIKETEGLGNVDIDWGDPRNTPQFAKPKQWSQLFFSLNKVGINRPLFTDEEGTHLDELNIKTHWLGAVYSEPMENYTWSMYLDGVDVVDHTVYPDVDTTSDISKETLEDGWENLLLDTGETSGFGRSKAVFRSGSEYTHLETYPNSKSALRLTFANTVIGDVRVAYSAIFSPEGQNVIDPSFVIPSFNKGTIKADFKFNNYITDKNVTFLAVEADDKGEWKPTVFIENIQLTDLNDGWYQLYFDFNKVPAFKTFNKAIRFGFSFPGVSDENKNNAEIFIDNVFYDENGTGPAPITKERGTSFQAGNNLTLVLPSKVSKSNAEIIVDIKINSSNGSHISFILFDCDETWDNYFGYFDIYKDSETKPYEGFNIEPTSDGYMRITIQSWLINHCTAQKPNYINCLFISGVNTNANGFIEVISVKEVDNPIRGEALTAGSDYDYWFNSPITISDNIFINIDVKATNGKSKIVISLMLEWGDDGQTYFGHYDLGVGDSYPGVTTTLLSDGYTRYRLELSKLEKKDAISTPTSINHITLFGKWSEVTGYIDVSTEK